MLYEEFAQGDTKLQLKSGGLDLKKGSPTGPAFVTKALLGVLVNEVIRNLDDIKVDLLCQ